MSESAFEHAFCCGRFGGSAGAGAREPFAFPGTSRKYARDRLVDVRHVRLEVAVDPEQRRIAGVAQHTAAALNDGTDHVVFDAAEMVVEGVRDGAGKALEFDHEDGALTVRLGRSLAAGEETVLSIAYHASPRRGLYFVGPDDAYPRKPLQAWTQGQDEDSRYWFPCFDYPNEKMTTEVVVTVPERFTAVSNGALVGRAPGATPGTVTWHWRLGTPHVAYLVTLVVGEFDEVALPTDGVPLPVWVPRGHGKDVERCFGRTPAMVKAFSERFGVPYPYEKYGQVVVADFIFGGMENTSATTLTEYALYDERAGLDYEADSLVAHELAHQWWGDLLTCRDWSHAWLNEGFATWSEALAKEHLEGQDEARYHLWQAGRRYFSEDAEEYRRPLVSKDYEAPIDVFDRHLYEKGGCVLHMLRAELGEASFWRSIRAYAAANRGRSVVTDDLRRAVEEATGKNLEWFFDQWIHRAGYPEFKASWAYDAERGVVSVSLRQGQRGDDVTPEAFRGTLDVEVRTGSTTRTLRLPVTEREHTWHVAADRRPDLVRFDPDGTWLATWSFDVGFDAHRRTLASDPGVVARLRAAGALAKDTSADSVQALARALRTDAFWGVKAEAARALAGIRTPAAREALLASLDGAKHPKARRAVVAALGAFRDDDPAAEALLRVLAKGDPSIFVEAEAAEALGRTRSPRARAALEDVLKRRDSWTDVVRAGAVRGLGHLGAEDAVPTLFGRLEYGHHPRVRTAAAGALAEIGARLRVRDGIRERLEQRIDDRDFRVQMAAVAALRALGDEGAVGALRRAADQALDGRVRRACRAASRRLERANDRTTEVGKLSEAVEALRRQVSDLAVRLDKAETRVAGAPRVRAATPRGTSAPKRAKPAKGAAARSGGGAKRKARRRRAR